MMETEGSLTLLPPERKICECGHGREDHYYNCKIIPSIPDIPVVDYCEECMCSNYKYDHIEIGIIRSGNI